MVEDRLERCPSSPNCVSSEARDAAHRVEPLPIAGDPVAAMRRLRRIIEGLPRTRIVAATDERIRAEFRSRIFRFVDDVDLVLDAEAGVVQVRSASRVGYSDLGANRRRVEALRRAFSGP